MTKPEFFSKLDFTANAPILIDGELYVYVSELPGGASNIMHANRGAPYLFVDPETGDQRLPTHRDIEFLLAAGRLKPVFMDEGRKPIAPPADLDIEEIEKLDKLAKARQLIVRLIDGASVRLSDAGLLCFMEEHCDAILETGLEALPHPSTVRRWLKFRGGTGDRPLAAMINMAGRVRRKRSFDPRTEKKLEDVIKRYWLTLEFRETDAVDEIHKFIDDHNENAAPEDRLKKPSAETVRQRIHKAETAELYKQKFGDKAFRQKYRTPRDRRLNATAILDTAIVDHTIIDDMLVLSAKHRAPLGRPTLALMVDVASRCILAHFITFDKPSLHTASQLLKRAVRPKTHLRRRFPDQPDGASVYGLMSTLIYDRALETIGVSHRDALADLGVEVIYVGAGEPQAKGIVERLFRTLNESLFHRLPGSVPLPASLMREMGYDPAETAVLTIEELEVLLEEAINVYHYQIHSTLGISPIQVWTEQAARRGIRTLADPSVLDKMAGIVFRRTLDRTGIRLFNLQYCCEKNVPILLDAIAASQRTMRGKRKGSVTSDVKIKVNPEDIGVIQVFNSHDKQYYELKCTEPDYAAGTSLWQHKEIRKFAVARGESFSSAAQRRDMRLALTRSIEEACPEISLKGKRAQKKLQDAFLSEAAFEEPAVHDNGDQLDVTVIEVTPAAGERADGGKPQHSPQRGKMARKANTSKGKTAQAKAKAVAKSAAKQMPSGLLVMTEEMRAAAASSWPTN